MKKIFLLYSLLFLLSGLNAQNSYTKYVDPMIGSGAHGHVFVGANVPFGAVQLGPNNIFEGWDWCSGYHYSSNNIIGFAHTHLSGTGIGDLGDILVMPATGKLNMNRGDKKDMENGYVSAFSHDNEIVKPGYYSVLLNKYQIKAELSATERVGFHQYTFPKKTDNPHLVIDLNEGIGWDIPTSTFIKQVNATTLVGYRFSKGWANDQRIFFAMELSQPLSGISLYDSTTTLTGNDAKGLRLKAAVNFNEIKGNVLRVKVGISPVSYENALLNIKKELPGWDFNSVVKAADEKWNKELNRIKITADEKTMKVFYTALYHTMIALSLFNDVNRDYMGTDKKIYRNADFNNYTTFSLWDTYRAYHPLYTIIHPERVNDIVKTMLAIYQQQGKLPVWHLMGNETNTMVGYHAVPVIVDAYLKGFRDYDVNLAYEAVKQSAMQKTDGIDYIQELQFIPAEKVVESVAKALEYAIDDWAIAQMAKAMGKTSDYQYFTNRSKLYKEYFDKKTEFMRGRIADGSWHEPFSPLASKHREDDYTEGNAWQYTWLVPHDVEGLMSLFGNEKRFITKLDSLFTIPAELGKESSPDISGLIGNYAHGNEPGHHILYLYAYAGQQWKTASWVRKVFEAFYTDKPDGLCGNEDVGQMSAWYNLSALGFYSVNPSNGAYVFGSPAVNSASISVTGNKTFNVKAVNNSKENVYIQKVTLNGKPYTKSFITHKDILKGGTLTFYMGSKPSSFGTKKADRPVSNRVY
ncbi:MAG: GH92 family glycosyl hydrolase [Sphingobacteriales bacterium]|nr:GH92 family glycosyl hydrolase [Sphingobacteriales bacterium]